MTVAEAKTNASKIIHRKTSSDKVININIDNGKGQGISAREKPIAEEDKAAMAVAPPPIGSRCTVPAAPPSELKYGDRLRLWARYECTAVREIRIALLMILT